MKNMCKKIPATVGAGALALSLVACSDSSESSSGDSTDSAGGEDMGTITLGYLPSWTDGLSTAYLLDHQLTEMGYEVEHETVTDAAVLYTGLANGDIDVFSSAWPEVTHADYMEEYGEDIEDLGSYYDGAKLNLSVPTYMEDINSVTDLVGQGERFGGTIYGIEPGAGLTGATQDDVMPGYGLDEEYSLQTSSTPAMLSELQSAVDDERDIVVTLWTPFWANGAFPVKALEDPEGLYGEAESLHFLSRTGFADEFPEAAEWIGQIQMTDEQYSDLEDTVVNQFEDGQELEAIEDWISRNPDVLPELPTQE